jgi:flagellar FliL protein
MSDTDAQADETPQKKSKLPLIIGAVLALAGGGGGFYATWSGLLLAPESEEAKADEPEVEKGPDVAFVPVDPLTISLGEDQGAQYLRFRAELEVPAAYKEDVSNLLPRVSDVFNSYLRALDPSDLEDRAALTRLRGQMLRRVQVVVGQDRVNDLLVMEFVLN